MVDMYEEPITKVKHVCGTCTYFYVQRSTYIGTCMMGITNAEKETDEIWFHNRFDCGLYHDKNGGKIPTNANSFYVQIKKEAFRELNTMEGGP